MNVALWIIAGALAAVFLLAGLTKLTRSKDQLAADPRMRWTEQFSPRAIKTIGTLEILAAIGLIIPAAVGIAPVLAPLAATGLVAVMTGAAITHARRHEAPMMVGNLVLLALAAVVAWGRFGPYSF